MFFSGFEEFYSEVKEQVRKEYVKIQVQRRALRSFPGLPSPSLKKMLLKGDEFKAQTEIEKTLKAWTKLPRPKCNPPDEWQMIMDTAVVREALRELYYNPAYQKDIFRDRRTSNWERWELAGKDGIADRLKAHEVPKNMCCLIAEAIWFFLPVQRRSSDIDELVKTRDDTELLPIKKRRTPAEVLHRRHIVWMCEEQFSDQKHKSLDESTIRELDGLRVPIPKGWPGVTWRENWRLARDDAKLKNKIQRMLSGDRKKNPVKGQMKREN